MRPAAKVHKLAVAIEAHLRAGLGEARHEVRLHEVAVAVELGQRLLSRLVLAHKLLVARNHLGHLRFNGRQVLRRERLLAVKVVEEPRIRGRPVAQLGLRKQLQHRRGQHVRSRVAHHLQRLGIVLLHQLQLGVFGERRGHVHQARRARLLGCVHGRFGGIVRLLRRAPAPAPLPETGVSRATTLAAARRGEMELAISSGVVPAGTSRTEPSGR